MPKLSKKTYHHGDLREALIQAAIELLPIKGASGLSLREVAKAAGVSHTAPYRHFKDKAALLTAIAQTGFELLMGHMAQVVENHKDDPRQQLIAVATAYVDLGLKNPELMNLMFGGILDPDTLSEEYCGTSDKAFDGLLEIIIAGQEAGVFKQENPKIIAVTAWSLVHGLMMLITAGHMREVATSPEQIEQLSRTMAENLITGILK